MSGSDVDASFEILSNRFIDWLRDYGTTISTKVHLEDLRARYAGRGAVAKEDIEQDEELFSIARSLVLTSENSSLPLDITKDLEDPWPRLILAMLHEHANAHSKWKPYLDILPTEFDTLMYWSAEELRSLEGSAVVHKIGKDSADKLFHDTLIPIIRNHKGVFGPLDCSDDDIIALCHRMGSTIMAYAFDLEDSTAPARNEEDGWEEDSDAGVTLPKGMVPLADMLNADADLNNARLFHEDGRVVMKATKAIKAGEELFNDYGPLPRADVLRRYGYVTDDYAKYDVVEVSLDLIKHTAMEEFELSETEVEARTQYLDHESVLDDGYDISRTANEDGPFSDELKIVSNALAMSKEEFDKTRTKGKILKPELSEQAVKLLYSLLVRRCAMYPSATIETVADVASQSGHAIAATERRLAMARAVIDGEKEVLREAAQSLRDLTTSNKKRKADSFEHEVDALRTSIKQPKSG